MSDKTQFEKKNYLIVFFYIIKEKINGGVFMNGLKKTHKFKIGLDVDDVLLPCIEQAIEWANRDYSFNPPITMNEIKNWNPCGSRSDVIFEYFKKEEFFRSQKPFPGARYFVKKLSRIVEVFIITAIAPEFTDIRAEQIREFFPDVPRENFIPISRKDVIDLDFIFDDGAHNILASNVKYPVLRRRPWNQEMTGILAANSYEEFLNLVECIQNTYVDESMDFKKPTILALVGPSGSGKSAIASELLKCDKFEAPISVTTRPKRLVDEENRYEHVSEEEFLESLNNGDFAETTVYAGHHYGTKTSSFNDILRRGKHCVIPIDISGAMTLRMQYRTCIIYIKRNRKDVINTLLKRLVENPTSIDDITRRIVSIDDEKKNENLSDFILDNNRNIDDAVYDILKATT